MTVRELKELVAALCDCSTAELEDSFYLYTNEAMMDMGIFFPKFARGVLGFYPDKPIFWREVLVSEEDDVEIQIPKGTLKMKVEGDGKYLIIDGQKRREVSFSYSGEPVVIEFSEGGSLKLFGGSRCTLQNISVYKNPKALYLSAVEQVGDNLIVDLTKFFPDLICLTENPVDDRGAPIPGLSLINAKVILLPKRFKGNIFLSYRTVKDRVGKDDPDQSIDIDTEAAEILPLIVASKHLLRDEPEISDRLAKEAEALRTELKKTRPLTTTAPYIDTTGW